jgi:putative ABC transport system substrate-binding protein
LRKALSDLGYREGQDIIIEEHIGHLADLPETLAGHSISLIFANGPAAVRAAHASGTSLPILALDFETDPVEAGLVESFARPGGNVTGIFLDQPELASKLLHLLREGKPTLTRVAAIWDPSAGPSQRNTITAAARNLQIDMQAVELGPGLEAYFRASDAQGLVLLSSPSMFAELPRLAGLALEAGLPAISIFRTFATAGGLLAYGPDFVPLRLRYAALVDRILKGAAPSEIPVEQPTSYRLVLNLRTATTLGLGIPPSLLARADEVIE